MASQLTYTELYAQVAHPLSILDLDKTHHAFGLQKFLNRPTELFPLSAQSMYEANQSSLKKLRMASIGLTRLNGGLVRVCFSLESLYVKGVLVKGRYYEMKKNEQAVGLVKGSVPLGKKGETYKDFGTLPPITLKAEAFTDLYHNCLKLGTSQEDLASVVYGLGVFALTGIEPLRQLTIQRSLVGESGRNKSGTKYAVIGSDQGVFWKLIHRWDDNSLMSQGLAKVKSEVDKEVRESATLDPAQVWDALEEVLIINSSRKVTYS